MELSKIRKGKINFIETAILQKKEIAAFHLNDVFCEYADMFYKNKSYKITLLDFKKTLKIICKNKNYKIIISKVDPVDSVVFNVRNIWTLKTI